VLLAIDVGNTETLIGTYPAAGDGAGEGGYEPELSHHWRASSMAERTADEHALLLAQLLGLAGVAMATDVSGVAISSVVPRITAALREMAERWFDVPTVVLGPGTRTGVPILYDNPREVGPDRIANAVAAFELYGGPTVMVDFGTATTCDAVSARGEYLGGAIVPGLQIGLDALFARAAGLRRVELTEPRRVIGRSTEESIESGVLYGAAAMVDGLVGRFEAELGRCTVVATGGLAGLVTPLSATIGHHQPWLTLHGLRLIFGRNR